MDQFPDFKKIFSEKPKSDQPQTQVIAGPDGKPLAVERTVKMITVYTHVMPNGDELAWNVDRAIEIVNAKPRPVDRVSPEFQVQILQRQEIDRAKLPFVDERIPGIVAPVIMDGEAFHVLIDGNHRCVKRTEQLKPFLVYVLTPQESRECLIFGDEKYLP